jgi:hypothetical protein
MKLQQLMALAERVTSNTKERLRTVQLVETFKDASGTRVRASEELLGS